MAASGDERRARNVALLLGLTLAVLIALLPAALPGAARATEPCTGGSGTQFGAGSWPPACWRPYSALSPFNRALTRSYQLTRKSSRIVRGTLNSKKVQGFLVGHPNRSRSDFGHPVYYGDLLDPLYTVRCANYARSCEVHGKQVHIPAGALPAGGSDAHMAVIDAETHWEYDFYDVRTVPLPPGGGTIIIGHGGRTPWGTAKADGLGSNATAAHFGLSAGMIRAEEWEIAAARNEPMNHALFAAVSCTNGRSVYPAAEGTNGAVCTSGRKAAPPLGTRYQLALTDDQIDALGVPPWKSAILKTLAHYGMIVGDTTGGNTHAFGLVSESDTQYTSLGYPGRFAELGEAWGASTYGGAYVFDIASRVKWRKHLRVVPPCVSRGKC